MPWYYTEPRPQRRPLDPVPGTTTGGGGGPPTGPAGGDLTGSYPNPTIAAGAVGDAEIVSVAWAKVTGAPATFPPSGPAGGDLSGSYPNPVVAAGAVGNAEISDVAWGKVTGAPTSFPPSGTAGGDLTGTYPNPTIAKLNGAAVGTTTPLARGDVVVAQGVTPTLARLALGGGNMTLRSNGVDVIWAVNAPGGGAGGDLGGNYPNPTVGRLNGAQLGLTTPLARGDILVANATPALTRLPRGSANQVLQSDGTDVVWGASLGGPPSGAAGGSLAGTYPNPTIAPGVNVRQAVVTGSRYAANTNLASTTPVVLLQTAITTTGGPVLAVAIPMGAFHPMVTGVQWMSFQLVRDGTPLAEWLPQAEIPTATGAHGFAVTLSCPHVDQVAAGAHTYQLTVKVGSASNIFKTGIVTSGELRLWELL